TLPDTKLSANVALRAGGNTFSSDQHITSGDIYLDNNHAIWAKNSSGTSEVFAWPRYSDNVTYMNYGAGGFNIRNNPGATAMFMANSGNVGIGNGSPDFPLSFPNSLGDKISLWGTAGNHFGFGIQSYQLQIHADTSLADIVFGY